MSNVELLAGIILFLIFAFIAFYIGSGIIWFLGEILKEIGILKREDWEIEDNP